MWSLWQPAGEIEPEISSLSDVHDVATLRLSNLRDGNNTVRVRGAHEQYQQNLWSEPVSFSWIVNLWLPVTTFLDRPDPVSTESTASFKFGCEVTALNRSDTCDFEYQLDIYDDAWVSFTFDNVCRSKDVLISL